MNIPDQTIALNVGKKSPTAFDPVSALRTAQRIQTALQPQDGESQTDRASRIATAFDPNSALAFPKSAPSG